jgi:hypothetical protein
MPDTPCTACHSSMQQQLSSWQAHTRNKSPHMQRSVQSQSSQRTLRQQIPPHHKGSTSTTIAACTRTHRADEHAQLLRRHAEHGHLGRPSAEGARRWRAAGLHFLQDVRTASCSLRQRLQEQGRKRKEKGAATASRLQDKCQMWVAGCRPASTQGLEKQQHSDPAPSTRTRMCARPIAA